MGILDDLAMGFGLKERTEDYDARTARNIAETQAFGDDHVSAMRARQGYVSTGPRGRDYAAEYRAAYNDPSGRAQQFLGSRGRDNYNPQIADDNRPFMQRLMTSPEGAASPTPYAIGPLSMDQPLPQFGLLGLFTKGLSGMFQGGDDTDASISVGKRAMGMLPADGDVSPVTGGSGQPETREEDFSGVDVYNPATDYIEPDFSGVIPATTAGQDFATNQDFLDTVQAAIDMTTETGKAPLSNANYYDPSGAFGMRSGTSSIRRLPNGKFVDILTGKYF